MLLLVRCSSTRPGLHSRQCCRRYRGKSPIDVYRHAATLADGTVASLACTGSAFKSLFSCLIFTWDCRFWFKLWCCIDLSHWAGRCKSCCWRRACSPSKSRNCSEGFARPDGEWRDSSCGGSVLVGILEEESVLLQRVLERTNFVRQGVAIGH